jgi:phytanoyl-CoA hydroxylase
VVARFVIGALYTAAAMRHANTPTIDVHSAAAAFARDGYVVVRQYASAADCALLRALIDSMLEPLQGPVEFEAETGYPGAPRSFLDTGGLTPRRLLHAYSRDRELRAWARDARVAGLLTVLFDGKAPRLSQCHHNCVMTKHPAFSSQTLWHQDIRYWSFQRPELISTWLALGSERKGNGALSVIPGSHVLEIDAQRYDQALFLRTDLAENKALIAQARMVELDAGDLLLFHCRTFHAAGANETQQLKCSLVFSYHDATNAAKLGTRSAAYPSIAL